MAHEPGDDGLEVAKQRQVDTGRNENVKGQQDRIRLAESTVATTAAATLQGWRLMKSGLAKDNTHQVQVALDKQP